MNRVKKAYSCLAAIIFVMATTCTGLLASARWLSPGRDPGAWWSLIHRLSQGEVLYRDVYPGLYCSESEAVERFGVFWTIVYGSVPGTHIDQAQ
jgi:hypothetical protein